MSELYSSMRGGLYDYSQSANGQQLPRLLEVVRVMYSGKVFTRRRTVRQLRSNCSTQVSNNVCVWYTEKQTPTV